MGSTTATLLVAYMLVLQGLVVGIALGPQSGRAGLVANAICATKGETVPGGEPALPGRSRSHADHCCVVHCSGAGVPPGSAWEEPPARVAHREVAWSGAAMDAFSPRPTLPVGSRAPPISII